MFDVMIRGEVRKQLDLGLLDYVVANYIFAGHDQNRYRMEEGLGMIRKTIEDVLQRLVAKGIIEERPLLPNEKARKNFAARYRTTFTWNKFFAVGKQADFELEGMEEIPPVIQKQKTKKLSPMVT